MSEPVPIAGRIGFAADEIRTDTPTREARLKWVVVVDGSLPPGRAVNAATCVAAATSRLVRRASTCSAARIAVSSTSKSAIAAG